MVLSKAIASFQQIQTRNATNLRPSPKVSDYRYFTIQGMKKHYAVLPLVAIMAIAVTGVCGYIVYACNSRTEVAFRRSKPTIAESMDMMNPEKNKILVFNQQYQAMPELDAALKAVTEE